MMLQKISQYAKKELDTKENNIEIKDVPTIVYNGKECNTLPFFRSIQLKLSEVFGV